MWLIKKPSMTIFKWWIILFFCFFSFFHFPSSLPYQLALCGFSINSVGSLSSFENVHLNFLSMARVETGIEFLMQSDIITNDEWYHSMKIVLMTLVKDHTKVMIKYSMISEPQRSGSVISICKINVNSAQIDSRSLCINIIITYFVNDFGHVSSLIFIWNLVLYKVEMLYHWLNHIHNMNNENLNMASA